MTKIMGAALLVSAGVLFGYGRAQRMWARAALLRELGAAVMRMHGAVEARQSLRHICSAMSGQFTGECGSFFEKLGASLGALGESGLGELWERCARESFGSALTERELAPFLRLGSSLGSGEGALLALAQCERELERAAECAEASAARDGRMWTALGAALGSAAAIVLI